MNFQESEAFIHGLYRKGVKPGLHRERELLAMLGNPERQLKFVHIAGTNGKGSTASMTASILHQAGYRTGLFTSPFIYRFNERIQMDGQQIADEDVVELTAYVKSFSDTMADPPTEFEFVTAMAMEYYRRKNCDIVVLEVGMGGLIDATNVIPAPEVAVVTNIGLDHTEVLGDTLEKIAANKAGIFKEGCHAVVYRGCESVERVYEDLCAQKNIPLHKADFNSIHLVSHGLEGQSFDCGSRKNIALPLLGDHQLHNASVVLSVADCLIERGWKISEDHIREGIRTVTWPGRFEIVGRDPLFIIDGGHNPQCIDALVKNVQDYLADRRVIVLTGVLADKDYADMFRPVMPYAEKFVCITPPNPRRMEGQVLAGYLCQTGADATHAETIEAGVKKALELAGDDGVVLCFGSLYIIGDIKFALDKVKN